METIIFGQKTFIFLETSDPTTILEIATFAQYRRTVGYYPTAVGYYRVIAQGVLKMKNPDKDLFKTPKNIKIRPITGENDKNEKSLKQFQPKLRVFLHFPGDLRSDNDILYIYISLSDLTVTRKSLILDKKKGPFSKWTVMDITL